MRLFWKRTTMQKDAVLLRKTTDKISKTDFNEARQAKKTKEFVDYFEN